MRDIPVWFGNLPLPLPAASEMLQSDFEMLTDHGCNLRWE
jgi:hypothetical protein